MAGDEGLVDQSEIEQLLARSSAPPVASDADKLLAQDDIEKLLSQAGRATPAEAPAASREKKPAAVKPSSGGGSTGEGELAQADVEFLLNQAQSALASVESGPRGEMPHGVAPFRLEQFGGAAASTEIATLDLVRDVDLDLRIELGRTHMYLEEILKLHRGSVVPLDKLAGDPVDIYANGRLIARGEVLVLNDNFCVRVAELVAGVAND
jgi:flagellar motor switch protein FliN